MPKASHYEAMSRLWEILNLIPKRAPGKSVSEIAASLQCVGTSVTNRTIERDLNQLSAIFGLVCNDDSRPYRWHWMTGRGADLPSMTLTDALSLKIAENMLRPLLPNAIIETLEYRFNEANNKLDALPAHSRNSSWLDKVRNVQPALSLLPPKIDEGSLQNVQTALLNDKKVEVEYQAFEQDKGKTQLLSPLALVQRGPTTYLAATANQYNDIRLYAMHRIHKATIMNEPVNRPEGFSIDEYIAKGALNFGSCEKIRLEAYLDEWLSKILQETPMSADQTITQSHDRNKLSATVEDTWQLKWWLLSQGGAIEIIKPNKLRNNIKKSLIEALEKYKD